MNPGSQGYPIASLYVGDLHPEVNEAMLYEKFSQAGPVVSIRVCRDQVTRRSLGYAYVNFQQPADAERALDTMNFDVVRGQPCRIMWSQRDPSLRRSGVGNIFIKRLDKAIDNKTLSDTFSTFGNILSCKVAADEEGNSKGYGFVHFETQEAADMAITKVNGMLLNNKQVFVSKFIPRSERVRSGPNQNYTNLYVKNFPESFSDEQLRELFAQHGNVTSAVVMKDEQGKSKRFGFVSFDGHEEAKAAEAALTGQQYGDKVLYVARAMKKAERQAELRRQFELKRKERQSRYQGVNLYIKNLEENFDDEKLREEFKKYGTITSAKVMQDETGASKGFGFVCFSAAEEATKAVTEMNGRIVVTKPLYVALHQRREERQAQLNAQRANRMTNRTYPGATGPMPSYYPPVFAMGMPQGQRPYFPPVPYRPGPWPQNPGVTGTTRPYGQSSYGGGGRGGGLRGQRVGGGMSHRGANPQSVQQRTVGSGPPRPGQQPMANQGGGRNIKYTSTARNYPMQQQQQQQQQQQATTPNQPEGLTHAGILLSDLATMTPEDQKHFLGERLYMRIIELDPQLNNPELAGKITGMLLEGVDVADIIHILESEPSLKEKVQEAIAVLQAHKQKEASGLTTAAIAGTA